MQVIASLVKLDNQLSLPTPFSEFELYFPEKDGTWRNVIIKSR